MDASRQVFSTVVDGAVFGLVDSSDSERRESLTLEPNDFLFMPPWDGTFST
jgi:hypothetical protein